jgi:glutathione transport system ATP-binding protein
LLAVQGLSVTFDTDRGPATVVRGLGFSVTAGETIALVGESGSGKSVTALAITRLIDYAGGRISAGGVLFTDRAGEQRDLAHQAPDAMRLLRGPELAMVFQEPMTSLNPVLTVGAQIAEPLMLHQNLDRVAARAEARRLLERVRIPDVAGQLDRFPFQLSGGMRQRVMIAIALACRPRLLIADEPTTALDVTIQAQVLRLIASLQAELDMGLIFITHDMGVVAEIADRVVVMQSGEKVEEGDVASIFGAPVHPYTRTLLAAVPVLGSLATQSLPMPFSEPGAPPPRVRDTVKSEVVLAVRDLTTRFPVRRGLIRPPDGAHPRCRGRELRLHAGGTLASLAKAAAANRRWAVRSSASIAGFRHHAPGWSRYTMRSRPRAATAPGGAAGFQDLCLARPAPDRRLFIAEPIRTTAARRPEIGHGCGKLLEQVGLPGDFAGRYPHGYPVDSASVSASPGQASEPRVIIADEAVAALDVSIRAQVINLLMDLQARLRVAYLFISHDMAVVERVAHRWR